MPDVESRKSDHSLISSGSGWLYIPKAICGQPKERVNHSNVTVYDAEESNPSGVPAISNLPTHPPTYSVRKILLTRPLTACKKETSGDLIDRWYVIVGWCGRLHLPKTVCGQLKERVNHHVIHNAYVSDVSRVGKSSSLKGVIQMLLYMMPKKVTHLGCLP